MAQTGRLLLVPPDALGHTCALLGALGGGQGYFAPPQLARGTLMLNVYPYKEFGTLNCTNLQFPATCGKYGVWTLS